MPLFRSSAGWVVLSTLADIRSLALTDAIACRLIPFRWLHPPCQEVWKLYPGLLPLPFAKLLLLAG